MLASILTTSILATGVLALGWFVAVDLLTHRLRIVTVRKNLNR